MTEEEILTTSLKKVNELEVLLQDNEWKPFLFTRLISFKYELQRQLSLACNKSIYNQD
jgi:hypothetical protein